MAKALTGAKKVVIVGIGNELNGDDGFGVYTAKKLGNFGRAVSIMAHTVPENFINKIASEKPSHVIFLDAAILDSKPGSLQLILPGDLARMRTMTHRIPLSKLIERLKSLHECKILVIGLQPKAMEVGTGLSKEAKSAANSLVDFFRVNLS